MWHETPTLESQFSTTKQPESTIMVYIAPPAAPIDENAPLNNANGYIADIVEGVPSVDLNAADWNLLPDDLDEDDAEEEREWSEEAEQFAERINAAVNAALARKESLYEVRSAAEALMWSGEGEMFGAGDTEPREVLRMVLQDIYGNNEDFPAI